MGWWYFGAKNEPLKSAGVHFWRPQGRDPVSCNGSDRLPQVENDMSSEVTRWARGRGRMLSTGHPAPPE